MPFDPAQQALGATTTSGVFAPRVETDKMLGATSLAEKVINMELTPENSMRTVSGPAMLISEASTTVHGIGHAVVNNHEVLIRQTDDRLQVFEGFAAGGPGWRDLTTPGTTSGFLGVDLTVEGTPTAPTQFIQTPRGIIIIPKGREVRPLFYDGEVLGTLGYVETPGAPTMFKSQFLTKTVISTTPGLPDGGNRVGVVENIQGSAVNDGRRKRTRYQGAMQWLDRWGNLSPLSPRSRTITISDTLIFAGSELEAALMRLRWEDVEPGPRHTVGRVCSRTRSLTTSGTTDLFELPQHAQPSSRVFATIPDNVSRIYCDNVSEGRLAAPALDVVPVPRATVGCIAMGRCWLDAPDGGIWRSVPGRFGTFLRDEVEYLDAAGERSTGLHAVPNGVLAFTVTSTHFITPADDGQGFRRVTLSSRQGCIAPSTIRTAPNGDVYWLGRDGFNMFSAGRVVALPQEHPRLMRQLNQGRLVQSCAEVIDGMYHCWIPHGASTTPNLCLVLTPSGWRRRFDTIARDVTISQDYRAYPFVAGIDLNSGTEGVLVLNHESPVLGAQTHTSTLETSWMLAQNVNRTSVRRLIVWARETSNSTLTIEIMRDWRENVVDTVTVPMHAAEDPPRTWDDALLDTGTWTRRRPYYGVVDVDIPSSEAVKFRFTADTDIDLVGFVLQTGESIRDGAWF